MAAEPKRSSSFEGNEGQPQRRECYFCGGVESARWHFVATLEGLLCDACHARLTALPAPPPKRKP